MDYVFTFLEGFASFISPCLLPMLPIYISYFAGSKEQHSKKKIVNALGFILGFTFIFIILSIFASTLGKYIGEHIKYIKTIFGIIIILLGLNYIGILKIQFLNRMRKLETPKKDLNFFRSILFGILFSVSWTPCIGSFLSSALLLISKKQDILNGIVLILLYSIGLGIPLLLTVVLMDQLTNSIQWIKKNYSMITKLSGAVLIGMGIYLIFF